MTRRCDNCDHWQRSVEATEEGICHGGTPQPTLKSHEDGRRVVWPLTLADERCPGWQAIPYPQHVTVHEAEIARLQRIIEGLTDRVAAQSELLSKKAERTPLGDPVVPVYPVQLTEED